MAMSPAPLPDSLEAAPTSFPQPDNLPEVSAPANRPTHPTSNIVLYLVIALLVLSIALLAFVVVRVT
jgi:hypothetical protein